MGKSIRQTIEPVDYFKDNGAVSIPDTYGKSTIPSTRSQTNFSGKDYPNLINPSPEEDPTTLRKMDASKQGVGETIANTAMQFGANFASSLGQGLANTFDLVDAAKTLKGQITGSNDDFNSSLFGLSAKEMQDWSNGIAQRFEIKEENPGSVDLSNPAWWAKQVASAGTSLGMAADAIATTAAIEYATGGLGTAGAIAKLGSMAKRIMTLGKGAEILSDAVSAARGLKSAATVYGIMSRTSESRMEANQSHQEIYDDLSRQLNPNGTPKFTEEEKQHIASEGARVTYLGNMALMPLDILSYRTMVFNPISGTGEGLIERMLGKIGNKILRKGVQYGVDMGLESSEEAGQSVFSSEGKHYAQVLSGQDDGSTFMDRLNKDVHTDEFWNNTLGGAIGGPVTGSIMRVGERVMHGNKQARINELHKNYVSTIGAMNDKLATEIQDLEKQGKTRLASEKRRDFHANQALAALHLDASTDRDTAFDAHSTFINGILGELNEGKTDGLKDLGFNNPTPEQVTQIKTEFEQYSKDAAKIKDIYDNIKTKYNRNFVPTITQQNFRLGQSLELSDEFDAEIAKQKANLFQYDKLTPQGKLVYDSEHQLDVLKVEHARLTNRYREAEDENDKEIINTLLEQNVAKAKDIVEKVNGLNGDDTYDKASKIADNDIISSSLRSPQYIRALHNKEQLDNSIAFQRKNLALWNSPKYVRGIMQKIVKNAKTKQQVQDVVADSKDEELKAAAEEKEKEIAAKEAEAQQQQTFNDDDFLEDEAILGSIKAASNVTPAPQGTSNNEDQEDEVLALFSPKDYDFDNSPDEAKQQVAKGVKGLIRRIGDEASFADLVNYAIKLQGMADTDEMYNSLKFGWLANNKPATDFDAVYSDIFENPLDLLKKGNSQMLLRNGEELKVETDKIEEDVLSHEEKPESFDNNNQPVYKYTGTITNEASPKGAFRTRLSHLVKETDADGNIVVSYHYGEQAEEDKNNKWVDSIPVLDPDAINEGTETSIRIPDDVNDITITVYNPDGSYNKSMTFGQYVAENNLSPEMQAYKDKIPMVHYVKGLDKGVMFVHDVEWYHPLRFNQEYKDDMNNAIKATREIREEVLNAANKGLIENGPNAGAFHYKSSAYEITVGSNIMNGKHSVNIAQKSANSSTGYVIKDHLTEEFDNLQEAKEYANKFISKDTSNNGSVPATITGKRQTTFSGLRLAEGSEISLWEANPDAMLTIVDTDLTSLKSSKNVIAFPNNETRLVNTKQFSFNGQIVEVRRFGLKDGIQTFLASPIIRTKLKDNHISSVTRAISTYANRRNLNDAQKKVVEQIKSTMHLDITTEQGLTKYLSHFISVFNTEKAKSNKDVEQQAAAKLAVGTPYIAFLPSGTRQVEENGKTITIPTGGNIVFGQAGVKQTTTVSSYFINPNMPNNNIGLEALNTKKITVGKITYPSLVHWYEQNLSLSALKDNTPVITINKDLTTEQAAPSYDQFVKQNLRTNLKSENIGTAEKPNYVTNIQPVITYDTNSRLKKSSEPKSNEEVREEMVQQSKPTVKEETAPKTDAEVEQKIVDDTLTNGSYYYYASSEDLTNEDEDKKILITKDNLSDAKRAKKELGDAIVNDKGRVMGIPEVSIVIPTGDSSYIEVYSVKELRNVILNSDGLSDEEEIKSAKQVYKKLFGQEFSQSSEINPNQGTLDFNPEDNAEAQRMIEEAKSMLGTDYRDSNDLFFSPEELTEQQTNDIASSIDRIAGLTEAQQHDIVDFMFNRITSMINLENKQATINEVSKEVIDAFNKIILPSKKEYKDRIAKIEGFLEKTSNVASKAELEKAIAGFKYRLAKIQAIQDSAPTLIGLAYDKVNKYTGITESKVKLEAKDLLDNSDNGYDGEDPNQREMDFWTDILTESPENKLTYAMRRFLGQMVNVDKNGNKLTGFLGLDTFVGADHVIKTLMVTLANVPASYDEMISKLEERKAAVPWMQQVIDKINVGTQQQKNQFVYVMNNTSLNMKFMMISFNRRQGTWSTKMYDTTANGVANTIKTQWQSNFIDSELVTLDKENNYILNTKKAQELVHQFETWKGLDIPSIDTDITEPFWDKVFSKIKTGVTVTFKAEGELANELSKVIVDDAGKAKVKLKGSTFEIVKAANGEYKAGYIKTTSASKEDVRKWLQEFGINLTDDTMEELFTVGLKHNYETRKWKELFQTGNSNGLVGILYNKLRLLLTKTGQTLFDEDGGNPLDDSVITSLANLDAKYNDAVISIGFRDGKKNIFGLTAPKYVTDRVREIKTADHPIIQQLKTISFSSQSLWLKLIGNKKFADKFNISHLGLTAMKEQGKKNYRDNSITALSDIDHEGTKLGLFCDTTQGQLEDEITNYPGTKVAMRMSTLFSPTMSDKQMMTLITTAVLDLSRTDLNEGNKISQDVARILYEQTVKPELLRMVKFWAQGGETNISAYNKGAAMFMLMPAMNEIELSPGVKLVDAIKHGYATFNTANIEANKELMSSIYDTLNDYVTSLANEKISSWAKVGLISNDEVKYIDSKYLSKFAGDNMNMAKMLAMDFEINSLIANANVFMTIAGDPALFYKEGKRTDENGKLRENTAIEKVEDSFVNVGKRLALLIAPGSALAESEHEKYLHVFLKDRKSLPEHSFLKFVSKINDGKEITDEEIAKLEDGTKEEKSAILKKYPKMGAFTDIEGSDAQEYTTWREHLNVIAKLGKTPENQIDISQEELDEAAKIFTDETAVSKLTEKQLKVIGKVLQPMKPVYTGQTFDSGQDVMRTVYIKSSSFPLIPQLTTGFEIDKLRLGLEKLESTHKMFVRASYQTANKVGSVTNPIEIWDSKGRINAEYTDDKGNFEIPDWSPNEDTDKQSDEYVNWYKNNTHTLVLERKNFRIQQDVPYKSGKNSEDKITLMTQMMKLLFGDEIMNYDGFNYQGKVHTGKELHSLYNTAFIQLVQNKRSSLFAELGLDENGTPVDIKKSQEKLQEILKDEAVNRGYPLQDIEGLKLVPIKNRAGKIVGYEDFNLPLWSSSNSNRYESMLNSIVSNRLIKMKFPGNSYVAGSEEGFRTATDILSSKDKIIFGHPGIGKSYLKESGRTDIIDFDEDYKTKINDELGLAKGFKARNEWRTNNKEAWDKKIRALWIEAKAESKRTGKTLLASDMILLKEFGSDFDKVINMSEDTFIKRAKQRNDYTEGSTENWKKNIDNAISGIDQSKIINTTGYLSDLMGINKSKIVFTSAWNGKSLQATREEDGKLKKAQVFVESKFRDNNGKMIDLFERQDGQYKYIEEKGNSFILKADMFDEALLSLISARIPTSGHQSGAQIEIAGFLPHQSGDLMILPRNFTKQKGLDFDIDKENTYQYWHYMTPEGRFEVLSEKHRSQILTEAEHEKANDKVLQGLIAKLKEETEAGAGPLTIKKIKSDINVALAGQKLVQGLMGDLKYTEEDIEDANLTKLNNKISEKLLQNSIVEIHHSVFGNPAIQHKINKTLNTDFAEEQAAFIESISTGSTDKKLWTPLSSEYQKKKMGLGASGKIGTGAYSLDVVGHSLFQQAKINGKPIKVIKPFDVSDPANRITNSTVEWVFGNVKSDGTLGGTDTLGVNGTKGDRSISEVLGERQNVAVDNEKLQIMGRVGLNDITLDVDKVLNLLGFDKGEDGNSISMLFLSQPIIKEFVEALKNSNSNLGDFEADKEVKIVNSLKSLYGETYNPDMDYSELMTNANFIEAIKGANANTNYDKGLQVAILDRFLELRTYGIAIRKIQTTINTDSKGLGKSFFDVIEKREALNELGGQNPLIQGARELLGDYMFKADNLFQIDKLLSEGYIDIGNYLVKPDTLSGAFNIYGVSTAYNLWNRYFPYDATITKAAFKELMPLISNGEVGDAKKVELKQEIFKGMKKYFSAFKVNGIISTSDDVNEERQRLYIDSDTNTSLARYLNLISQEVGNPVIDQFIKSNKLLNRFEYDIQKNGQPSKIRYNNAAGEEFDEQYLYRGLTSLLAARDANGERIKLPKKGNKEYTLDTLAQDLIAYSYLGNSTQEAIQFTKFVPMSYLDNVGYSKVMRQISKQLANNPNLLGIRGLELAEENTKHLVSEYTMQFIQHNPERLNKSSKLNSKEVFAKIIEAKFNNPEGEKAELNHLQSFKIKDINEKPTTFKVIYNSSITKGEKKFQLYWYDGSGTYVRIPVLGTFGMDEYQPSQDRNTIGKSIVNGITKVVVNPQADTKGSIGSKAEDQFNIESGDMKTVLDNISKAQLGSVSAFAKELIGYADPNIKLQFNTQVADTNGMMVEGFYGVYSHGTNSITLNPTYFSKGTTERNAMVLLEEIVHSLTVKPILAHVTSNEDGSIKEVSPDAPPFVTNLVRLFNHARKEYDTKALVDNKNKILKDGIKTQEEADLYGISDIYEFMARAIANKNFQKFLSEKPFMQSGMSILDKFKQFVSDVLKSLGIDTGENSVTAQVISNTFSLIEANKVPEGYKSLDEINTELSQEDFEGLDIPDEFDENNNGPDLASFSPQDFPVKQLDIQTVKCN